MQLLHSITLNTKLQDFYQFAQVHPQIKAYLEQGYSLSLPYPMHQKKPIYKKWELVFFLYKEQEVAAGTYQQSPPDWYVLINFSTFKTSKLIKARPSKFGLKTANLQAFEKTDFTPPSPTETKQFFSLYTTLLVLYFEGKQKGTKEEIATIQQGRELLFGNMLSAPMQPYFRSINPYFVKWLYQF